MATFPPQSGTVSTAMATATADAKPIGYAAKEGWVKHRTLIAQLYEERSLAEVMDFMERQHGFRATTKMYKTHIKKYGLDKKNKELEMRAIVRKQRRRAAQGKQSLFRIRGRTIDYESVIRYWKRKGISIEESIAQPRECATPEALECVTPIPSPIVAPKALAIPEWLFASIGNYYKGSFGSGTWIHTSPELACQTIKARGSSGTGIDNFLLSFLVACDLPAEKAFQEVRTILISAAARVRNILSAEHPSTLSKILRLFASLRFWQRHDIALAILRNFSALGAVVLGNEHPLPRIWTWLTLVDPHQTEEILFICLKCISDHFESLIGPMHMSTLQSRIMCIGQVYIKGDIDQAEAMLRDVSHMCEIVLGPSDIRTLQLRISLVVGYLVPRANYIEAEKIALDVVTRAQHLRSRVQSIHCCAFGLWTLGDCQCARGDLHSASPNIRAAINLRISEWGKDDGVAKIWCTKAERLQIQINPVNVPNGSRSPVGQANWTQC
ncbi:hypothetical protein N7G274_009593 [Stereocaulon virgatum]|uniref:Clr5 domain-containing protein n=1 Tax=Stereocaulon virgatum TaxID=373712 RepID=A0ABR3ZWF8_9LECA